MCAFYLILFNILTGNKLLINCLPTWRKPLNLLAAINGFTFELSSLINRRSFSKESLWCRCLRGIASQQETVHNSEVITKITTCFLLSCQCCALMSEGRSFYWLIGKSSAVLVRSRKAQSPEIPVSSRASSSSSLSSKQLTLSFVTLYPSHADSVQQHGKLQWIWPVSPLPCCLTPSSQ